MNCPPALLPAPRSASHSRQFQLGGRDILLDQGQVAIVSWSGPAAMAADLAAACALDDPVVRYAGGALISDLSLQDNLMLEAALLDGSTPVHLLPEMDCLFEQAGCPIDWRGWQALFPHEATPLILMQLRVGRALMADPDLLLVDAEQWDDMLIAPGSFSASFSRQYPWRTLVWAHHSPSRAKALRHFLKDSPGLQA